MPVRPSKRGWKSERLSRYRINVTYHTAAPALIYMYSSCVHHTRTHTHTHTHIHTHTHTHVKKMTFSCNLIEVMCTWQSQDACALSRHCEPCKQSSWSWAWNSQENRPFLTASGVGTHWAIAVSGEKALNFHPSKCQVPNHSWVDWWGWWEADGKLDGKIA